MTEPTRTLLLSLLSDRIKTLEGSIYSYELLQDRDVPPVLRKRLEELMGAYSELIDTQAL